MVLKVKTSAIYNCSLERAFKTPMLCDISKVHTGFGINPRITHSTEDKDWGQINSSKKIFSAKSIIQNGGFSSMDHILEREENKYWKIQVDNFQYWVLGFYKFVGIWKTTELETNKILIEYTYDLHSKNILLYPFQFVFAKLFWKQYMKQVLNNIKLMAYNEEPYMFE